MTLATLQQVTCNHLSADPWLAARRLSFIAESRADAPAAAERALASIGIFGLVTTPAFNPAVQDGSTVQGSATVSIQIIEAVASNRVAAGWCSALDAAERVAMLLLSQGALRFIRLLDTARDEAVAYQVEIDIAICLTLTETTEDQP